MICYGRKHSGTRIELESFVSSRSLIHVESSLCRIVYNRQVFFWLFLIRTSHTRIFLTNRYESPKFTRFVQTNDFISTRLKIFLFEHLQKKFVITIACTMSWTIIRFLFSITFITDNSLCIHMLSNYPLCSKRLFVLLICRGQFWNLIAYFNWNILFVFLLKPLILPYWS